MRGATKRPTLGVVLIHYHSPALVESAVAALHADAAGSGLAIEVVVVDNEGRSEELAQLEEGRQRWGYRLHATGRNAGYGGGANVGAALLPAVDVLVPMNPDVLVEKGCLAALLARIEAGAAVAGPTFYWDHPGGFFLPPTEPVGLLDDLLRVAAAGEAPRLRRWARRRWRRHAWHYLLATEAVEGYDLSGALMMIDAQVYRQLGGFDERFTLYFEETDLLQRVRRAGLSASFEPRAKAVHLYAQSTPRDGRPAALFTASQQLFRSVHYGRFGHAAIDFLARRMGRVAPEPAPPLDLQGRFRVGPGARFLEISPLPLGFPAAVRPLEAELVEDGEVEVAQVLSPELQARMSPGFYWLRSVDAAGRELAVALFEIASR